MDALISKALDAVWPTICEQKELSTPSSGRKRSTFTVFGSDAESVRIETTSGSKLKITRDQISAALKYLVDHRHDEDKRCKIMANNVYELAGPLCQATRNSKQPMVITYIVPLLASAGLVAIDGSRPNQVWLV